MRRQQRNNNHGQQKGSKQMIRGSVGYIASPTGDTASSEIRSTAAIGLNSPSSVQEGIPRSPTSYGLRARRFPSPRSHGRVGGETVIMPSSCCASLGSSPITSQPPHNSGGWPTVGAAATTHNELAYSVSGGLRKCRVSTGSMIEVYNAIAAGSASSGASPHPRSITSNGSLADQRITVIYPRRNSEGDVADGGIIDLSNAVGDDGADGAADNANLDLCQVRVEGYFERDAGVFIPNDLPRSTLLYVLTASDGRDCMFKAVQYSLQLLICFLKTPSLFSPEARAFTDPWADRFFRNYNTIRHGRSLFKMGRGLLNIFTLQTVCERLWMKYGDGVTARMRPFFLQAMLIMLRGGRSLGFSMRSLESTYTTAIEGGADVVNGAVASKLRDHHFGSSAARSRLWGQERDEDMLLTDELYMHMAPVESGTYQGTGLGGVNSGAMSGDLWQHASTAAAAVETFSAAAGLSPSSRFPGSSGGDSTSASPTAAARPFYVYPQIRSFAEQPLGATGGGTASLHGSFAGSGQLRPTEGGAVMPSNASLANGSSTNAVAEYASSTSTRSPTYSGSLHSGTAGVTVMCSAPQVVADAAAPAHHFSSDSKDMYKSIAGEDVDGPSPLSIMAQTSDATAEPPSPIEADTYMPTRTNTATNAGLTETGSFFAPPIVSSTLPLRTGAPPVEGGEASTSLLKPIRDEQQNKEKSGHNHYDAEQQEDDDDAIMRRALLRTSTNASSSSNDTSLDNSIYAHPPPPHRRHTEMHEANGGEPTVTMPPSPETTTRKGSAVTSYTFPSSTELGEDWEKRDAERDISSHSDAIQLEGSHSGKTTTTAAAAAVQSQPKQDSLTVPTTAAAAMMGTQRRKKDAPPCLFTQATLSSIFEGSNDNLSKLEAALVTDGTHIIKGEEQHQENVKGSPRSSLAKDNVIAATTTTPEAMGEGSIVASLLSSDNDDAININDAAALYIQHHELVPAAAAAPARNRKGILQFNTGLMVLLGVRNLAAAIRRFLRDLTLLSSERFFHLDFVEANRPAIHKNFNYLWLVVSIIDLFLNTRRLMEHGWGQYAMARQNVLCRCGCIGDADPNDTIWRSDGYVARHKTDLYFPELNLDYGAPYASNIAFMEAANPSTMMPACRRCGCLYKEVSKHFSAHEETGQERPRWVQLYDAEREFVKATQHQQHSGSLRVGTASVNPPTSITNSTTTNSPVTTAAAMGHGVVVSSSATTAERSGPTFPKIITSTTAAIAAAAPPISKITSAQDVVRAPQVNAEQGLQQRRVVELLRQDSEAASVEGSASPLHQAQKLAIAREVSAEQTPSAHGMHNAETVAKVASPVGAAGHQGTVIRSAEPLESVEFLFIPWLMRKMFNYVWLVRVHPNLTSTLLLQARYMAELFLAYKYCFGGYEPSKTDAPLLQILHPVGAVAGIVSAAVGLLRVIESAPKQ